MSARYFCFRELFCYVWRMVSSVDRAFGWGKMQLSLLLGFWLFTWKSYRQVYLFPVLSSQRWIKCRIFSTWPVSTGNAKIWVHNSQLFQLRKSSTYVLMPTKSFMSLHRQSVFSFMDLLLLSSRLPFFPCAENIRQICSGFANVNFSIAMHHGPWFHSIELFLYILFYPLLPCRVMICCISDAKTF